MSSTSKTTNLRLNSWSASDRPKRSDFVSDNNIIDAALGGHINNSQIHLSESDREKLKTSSAVFQFQGSGSESREVTLPFEPAFAVVYKKNDAPVTYNSSGYTLINSAFAAQSDSSSGGAVLDGVTLTLTQSTGASNGVFYNLNKQYAQYIVFMIH